MEIATAVPASNDGGGGGGISPAERSSVDSSSSPSASSSSGSVALSSPEQVTRKDLNALASRYDDDEEEEDVCRICRNPGEPDNLLRYPCACSGSIKYVHQDCLLQWLNHSNARQCEAPFSRVCGWDGNESLPCTAIFPTPQLCAFCMAAHNTVHYILDMAVGFVRSFGEAHRLFLGHLSTTIILTDCLHGFLLSASIVFIFLGATSLRDYFRHLRELGGQEADREDDGDRNAARAPRRPAAPANRNFAADGNAEDANGAQELLELVLASNMIFLGVVIFVPFSLGRIILYYLSWLLSSASNPVLSTVMPLTETALSLANITLKSAWTAVANLTHANEDSSLLGQVTEMLKANATELSEAANNLSTTVSTDFLKGSSVGTSRLSDVTTLAVGYMFIFSLVFFYLGIVALIRYTRGEPLTLGRFYGIASIAETIPSLFRQFVAAMRHLMTMIKVAFLLVIELGVFPLMCGWWLDVCTIRMFGKSITQRVAFFSVSPLASSLVHWVVGIVYMLQISIFVSLLRGVLRNGVLYFLRDPADPNYNPFRDLIDDPVHKHARRVLLSVAVYGSLIVMLVYLPVKLAMRMAPSIFPLDISVSDPFTEIPADMLLFQICIPFAIEHFKLRTTIKSLLRYWFTAVGWALGLTDFLLPRPEDNGGQENGDGDQGRQDRFQAPHVVPDRALVGFVPDNRVRHAATSSNFVEDYDNEEQADPDRYAFVLRILLLLVVAWMTLLLFNSALIIVPISLGRALFNSLPLLPITHGIKCNDLYAFVIGSYAIWTAIAGARYSIDQIRTRRVAVLMNQIWKWCVIVLKSSALLSIWIFIIPVLIGLLFELLVIVPMRVPIDESPVFLLYQDWALGLIFLKIWTRLVMLDHMMPLLDESWRLKFERVRENGFSRLQGFWVLREIVFPIIMKLLTALCVPYVLARGVFPVFGYPLLVNSAVYRFAWIGCLGFSLFCFCAKRFHVWFTNLHNSIRDDRYLIGRRLHNFGEEAVQRQNELEVAREGEIPILNGDVQEVADVGLRHRRGVMQDA
ncbi:hypothetical protein K7X08_008885 [Anisodus acutangulus]|uniref:RING-type E3 ubiquitin transferase n=1 Tax=Anisodus acutangulus TaxID=402998 RepID=A0A9Q1RSZ2_9SOLA|nr:hypothetical protein K7X08_008885 [Anisodus acutangulus]